MPRLQKTANLAFAGYALMRGLRIVKAESHKETRGMEYLFVFEDADDQWGNLLLEFANSEAQRHDQAVRQLKQLCKRGGV